MKINNIIDSLLIKYRRFIIISIHFILIIIAYLFSFFIRFEFELPKQYFLIILQTLPFLIIIRMVAFYYFGLFSNIWRYVSIGDFLQILKATTSSTIIFILTIVFIYGLQNFPRSIFILEYIFCIVLLCGMRLCMRIFKERIRNLLQVNNNNNNNNRKTLIIGAGETGILTLKECRRNPNMGLNIIGFIDDDPTKKEHNIYGIEVLGGKEDIARIVKNYAVVEIIIAVPSAKGEVIREILSYCQLPHVKIKIIPSLHKIIRGDLQIKPRDIHPEDLLGREVVKIDEKEIASYLKNKNILITGAGGSIGSELCRQIAGFSPKELILFDHDENNTYFLNMELKTNCPKINFRTIIGDIRDIGLLKNIFSNYQPDVVFHSAAHKHVPLMEENPIAAVKNNIIGTRNLIYASEHYKIERFVLVSTDKAVNPISIMGKSKRIAEMILQAKAKISRTKFMAVRFGNVIGSAGSVVPLFEKQIKEGGPLTITHPDAKRYFMSAKEATLLVLQAGAIGKGGEIFILDMGEQIKIVDIAKNLINFSGFQLDKDIAIKFTGLRPGEKVSEEILLNTEKDKITKCDKIYIAHPDNFDQNELRKQIKELEKFTNEMNENKVLEKIKEIINHSSNN